MSTKSSDLTSEQYKFVSDLRDLIKNKDFFNSTYCTDYNLMRWGRSNDFHLEKTAHKLGKHLKTRKRMAVEGEMGLTEFDPVARDYMPMSILGPASDGADNRQLVVVDMAGRVDIAGVMRSVQMTPYMNQRHRFMENIYARLMEMETDRGCWCGVTYLFDLEGLTFDASLLSVVTGPFRLTWTTMADHYVEWVDKFVILNAPSFINMLWAAFTPFVPDRFKKRVIFLSTNKQKQEQELISLIDRNRLPVHYGGELRDDSGDAMCRQWIKVPEKVPSELYWKEKAEGPRLSQMNSLTVPAAGQTVLGYEITEAKSVIEFFLYHEQECSFAILYTTDENETDIKKMDTVFLNVVRAGLTTLDHFKFLCEKAGLYYIKFGNETAWLMSVSVKYELRFSGGPQRDSPISPRQLHKTKSTSGSWFL